MTKRILAILIAACGLLPAPETRADSPTPAVNIVDHITEVNDNEVVEPDELTRRVASDASIETEEATHRGGPSDGRAAGYRVQVFSDNNRNTAKDEANKKARQLRARFPQYRSYVQYTAPYWRLRVGDFRTQAEANAAAAQIRAAFPAMSKELRVVKDRINASSSN